MIKTALVAMTIVGCDCDAKLCEYIGETPAKWSTIADCEAAMKNQMLHHRKGFSYPVVSGICRTVQPQTAMAVSTASPQVALAPLNDEIAALGLRRPEIPIGRRPTPVVNASAEPDVDGGDAILYRTESGYTLVKTRLDRTFSDTAMVLKRSAGWLSAQLQGNW
ncbi:hypothetical protein [Mesorhizobium sp. 1M-11]|uniref:hypothetical protein n=1 Tax=Mesorhizobium sp. 1M-11 TaxID=1529006 RepID=UPI0006C74CA7|nr:hypothetical protein [Mesorhizobium sp. 1M-11]